MVFILESNFIKKINSKLNLQELSKTNMPKHPRESITRGQYQIKEILLETLSWMVTGMPTNCSRRYRSDSGYHIKFLVGTLIRSCYGCGLLIRLLPHVPPRPYIIVIYQEECRTYITIRTDSLNLHVQPQNVHYHCRSQCILRNHEEFDKKVRS